MALPVRHPFSRLPHGSLCHLCGGPSYAPLHAPTDDDYRARVRDARRDARLNRAADAVVGADHPRFSPGGVRPARVPSSSKCRFCGTDLRGMYGSDRMAHKDGWCGD